MTSEEYIDLRRVFEILLEEWRVIFIISALSVAVAIAYALSATPVYLAQTELIDAEQSEDTELSARLGGLASMVGANVASRVSSRRARAVLKSRALAQEFINRNGLVSTVSPDGSDSTWVATDYFLKNIWQVSENIRTGTVTASIEWTDPEVAADWANGMVGLANEMLREQDIREAERSIAYLNDQVSKTSAVGVQQVLFNLIEDATQQLTLANARPDYAFTVIDPAVTPERRIRPRRMVLVMLGFVAGLTLALVYVAGRRLLLRSE